jgi:hypothetical protein
VKADRLGRAAERAANSPRAGRDWAATYHLARVSAVLVEDPQPTWALTVDDVHTHVTSGLVSHNTAGDWRWDQANDHGPDEDVWKQVMLYALALVESGHVVRTVRITYLKRENGHDVPFVREFDQALAERARDELIATATALDIGDPLPRDRSGPSTDALCRRCFARSHCWNLVAAGEAGRSGESFTILGPDPTDPDIEWAIEQNVLAKEAYREAEKAKKETAALIEGLEARRYGPWKITLQDYGNRPDYKGYAEQIRELLKLPEDQRPDLADVPVPKTRPHWVPIARRESKATLEKEARIRAKHAQRAEGGDAA